MDKQAPINTGEIDLQAQYEKFKGVLKGATKGNVVTRFPPEPSGYLHIGHVKAAMINFHYSRIYEGKMILRFDDTNPMKEKDEYVQSIIEDLKTLNVQYDQLTHTSDWFDKLMEIQTDLIKQGKCYCDNTPREQMQKERGEGTESKCRLNNTIEQNLEIWKKMIEGDAKEYCVRGKGNMQNLNKCMRDPVFYRYNDQPHHRTGTKYKVYPTYDFACPIVDSLEGVTHTMRTNEYSDRIDQYYWVLDLVGLRKPTIYEFSRLNFVRTVLSKRNLKWFVDTKQVEGWDDPRFPTVRGVMRRGVQVDTLIEFMLEQGPSKNTTLQQWDKFWAINQKYIDAKAPRYTAISKEKIATLVLTGGTYSSTPQVFEVAVHPKRTDLGKRPQFRTNELYIEYEDAITLAKDEKFTLMKWCNAKVTEITPSGDSFILKAELLESDTDFKSTKKINWLPKCDLLVDVNLNEYDALITTDKIEENVKIEDVANKNNKFTTPAFADPNVKNLAQGTVLQFERRGYFIVDRINRNGDDRKIDLNYIPDGKSRNMSNLSGKVDQAKSVLGDTVDKPKDEKKDEAEKKEKKEKKEAEKKEKKEGGEKKEKKEKKEGAPEEKKEDASATQPQDKKEEKKEEPKQDKPKADAKADVKTEGGEVTLADFGKLDIRVGKINECWNHPDSDKLYCEKIDLGDEVRQIGSGLRQFVQPQDMTSGLCCVLANLKPRKLAGFESNGMVLCPGNADHTVVELLRPDDASKIGERVVLDGFDGISQSKEKVIDPKKKILETVLPHLKTDSEGYASFLGKRLKTSAGFLKASNIKDAHIS